MIELLDEVKKCIAIITPGKKVIFNDRITIKGNIMNIFLRILIVLISFFNIGYSEIIFLKEGQVINGEIKGFNNGIYTLETKYGTLQIDNNQILQIKYDTSSVTTDSQIKPSTPEIIQSTKSVSISTFSEVSENISLNTTNLKILTGKRIKLARGFRIEIYDNSAYIGYMILDSSQQEVIDKYFNITDALLRVYDKYDVLTNEIEIKNNMIVSNKIYTPDKIKLNENIIQYYDKPFCFAFGSLFDFSGKQKGISNYSSVTADVENDFSISGEFSYLNKVKPIEIGIGVNYQFPRGLKYYKGNFNFTSFYLLSKIYFAKPTENSNPYLVYLVGHLGFNSFNGDNDYKGPLSLSGGVYYGVGIGMGRNHLFFQILYSVNNGSAEFLGKTADIKYSKVSLSLGVF